MVFLGEYHHPATFPVLWVVETCPEGGQTLIVFNPT